jgi:hypothetical protein
MSAFDPKRTLGDPLCGDAQQPSFDVIGCRPRAWKRLMRRREPAMLRLLRALFQFSKRAAGEATKLGRGGVKLLGVGGAARLECGEPAAESGELIRRQLGNSFGDFFDFHGAQLTSSNLLLARKAPLKPPDMRTFKPRCSISPPPMPPSRRQLLRSPKKVGLCAPPRTRLRRDWQSTVDPLA